MVNQKPKYVRSYELSKLIRKLEDYYVVLSLESRSIRINLASALCHLCGYCRSKACLIARIRGLLTTKKYQDMDGSIITINKIVKNPPRP